MILKPVSSMRTHCLLNSSTFFTRKIKDKSHSRARKLQCPSLSPLPLPPKPLGSLVPSSPVSLHSLMPTLGHSTQGHPTSTKPVLEATLLMQLHLSPVPLLDRECMGLQLAVPPAGSKRPLKLPCLAWPPFVPYTWKEGHEPLPLLKQRLA